MREIPPIEIEVPIELFDGWEVYDKETNEFLGWVNAKEKCIEKITITLDKDDKFIH